MNFFRNFTSFLWSQLEEWYLTKLQQLFYRLFYDGVQQNSLLYENPTTCSILKLMTAFVNVNDWTRDLCLGDRISLPLHHEVLALYCFSNSNIQYEKFNSFKVFEEFQKLSVFYMLKLRCVLRKEQKEFTLIYNFFLNILFAF
jgi:hypothetical protein